MNLQELKAARQNLPPMVRKTRKMVDKSPETKQRLDESEYKRELKRIDQSPYTYDYDE